MSWNYRVIKSVGADGDYYAIHEVYYEDDTDDHPRSWSAEPVTVGSSDHAGLKWILAAMLVGVQKSVLSVEGSKLVEAGSGLDLGVAAGMSRDLEKLLRDKLNTEG